MFFKKYLCPHLENKLVQTTPAVPQPLCPSHLWSECQLSDGMEVKRGREAYTHTHTHTRHRDLLTTLGVLQYLLSCSLPNSLVSRAQCKDLTGSLGQPLLRHPRAPELTTLPLSVHRRPHEAVWCQWTVAHLLPTLPQPPYPAFLMFPS